MGYGARAAKPNPWIGVNYFPHAKMETPPAFWLQRLYDFDAALVVFPSRYRPFAYVLARRAIHSDPLTNKALADTITQPDTVYCLQNGWVPVSLIYRTGTSWSIDNIIADLKSRDIWARGGAEKVADQMDAADASKEAATKAATRDDMWTRSGDAWRSYQARTGQRTKLSPTIPRHGAADKGSSGSTAGLGHVTLT